MSEPLVVGIEGVLRNHPIPRLDNFVVVPWSDQRTIESADVFIQANIAGNKEKEYVEQYQYIIDSGKPFICVESPVFRSNMDESMRYHRFSWWSYFRDEGDYANENSPNDRWQQISQDQNLEVKPWRENRDGHILLCLQRPGDSSLQRVLIKKKSSYQQWIWRTIRDIRRYTDRTIRIRIHPFRREASLALLVNIDKAFDNIEISDNHHGGQVFGGGSGGDGFLEDMNDAHCVVGLNSNALTESVMQGVPTFSLCPSSMAWPVSNHYLRNIETPRLEFDRTQWLHDLSYCQWREDEIERGEPWIHLKKRLPQLIRSSS